MCTRCSSESSDRIQLCVVSDDGGQVYSCVRIQGLHSGGPGSVSIRALRSGVDDSGTQCYCGSELANGLGANLDASKCSYGCSGGGSNCG